MAKRQFNKAAALIVKEEPPSATLKDEMASATPKASAPNQLSRVVPSFQLPLGAPAQSPTCALGSALTLLLTMGHQQVKVLREEHSVSREIETPT